MAPIFDHFYEESEYEPRFLSIQFHPFISGRAGRAAALLTMIRHMKKAEGVWFATGSEISRWCLDEVFVAEHDGAQRLKKAS